VLARRLPQATIALFEQGTHISYAACGLPFYASGEISSFEELNKTSYGVVRNVGFFRRSKGIGVITRAKVTGVNRTEKYVTVQLIDSGKELTHGYGKLVLVTGSRAKMPGFSVAKSPLIKNFTRPSDAIYFRSVAQAGSIGKAIIVGGGFIGCELAEATSGLWKIETVLIEREAQLLPRALDSEMAAFVQRSMKKNNVQVLTGYAIEKIVVSRDGKPIVVLRGGHKIESDIVFLCLGVEPEATLARECGLEIGATGAIVVDNHMRTSDPNIYAGGDCVESKHLVTGNAVYFPMGSIANRHGWVIAEDLAGKTAEFPGILGAFILKSFEINVGAVGLTEKGAKDAGYDPLTVCGSFVDKPDYFPESKPFSLKMVYRRDADKLLPLGLQAAGPGDIARPLDVFSLLLAQWRSLDDFLDFEHVYAPPFAEAVNPLFHMASMAMAQARGFDFIGPDCFVSKARSTQIWLDVREPDESTAEPITLDGGGKVVCIPLGELGEKIQRLDCSARITIICKRGPRAYQAAVILRAAGFKNVSILGGGVQAFMG
jgi:NADPH-dependent 2,4-dienoyl-CoA reductase/sulfur reductase-like enzyme/rhodanese-related sulfurtransferase